MQKKIGIWSKNFFFLAIVITLAFFIINHEILSVYWNSPMVSGWDGVGHAAIGKYYAENIFPNMWGWVPQWLGGMPFPQFYPPLFFFLTALASKILFFISYFKVFKLCAIFLQLSVPIIFAWITRSITKSVFASWIAGIVSLALLSAQYLDYTGYGIAIYSTFNVGFVAQLLGFVSLLIWINYFFKVEENIKARYISIFFLSTTFLSNVHIVPVAVIIFIITFIVNSKKYLFPFNKTELLKHCVLYMGLGVIPLMLAAFWLLPLFKEYTYLLTAPIWINTLEKISGWWYMIVFIALAIGLGIKNKNRNIVILSLVNITIVVVSLMSLDQYFPSLPLHSARWLGEFYFLNVILIAYVAEKFINVIKNKVGLDIYIYTALIFISCGILQPTNLGYLDTSGIYTDADNKENMEIFDYMKEKTGRVMIENYITNSPVSITFDSVIGNLGDGTATFILRESSITNLFTVPTRNSLSQNSEAWGVKSFKSLDRSLLNRSFEENLVTASELNVKYFLIKTPLMKDRFAKNNLVTLEKDFGDWQLFTFKNEISFAEVLQYEPVLLFSHLNFKERTANEYNYSRIQEELFFGKPRGIVIANARNLKIDVNKDLEKFKSAILSDYNYTDINKAFERLEKYSLNNYLYIIYAEDELFNKLSLLDSKHHIVIIPRNINIYESNIFIPQTNLAILLDKLEANKIPVVSKTRVTGSGISKTHIQVTLTDESSSEVPVLIKETYFPAWKNTDTSPVYLATPTFMLTFAKKDFGLDFTTDSTVYIGWIISFLTFIALIVTYRLSISSRKKIEVNTHYIS